MTVAALNVAPPNGVGSADWALIEIEATSPTMTQGAETGRPEQAPGHDRRIWVRFVFNAATFGGRCRTWPVGGLILSDQAPLLMWRSD
jgi:hypothetical protein